MPAGTPRDIVLRLNREIGGVLAQADVKQKLAEQGADPIGGAPEVFAAHVRAEREKWGKLIRDRNITVN